MSQITALILSLCIEVPVVAGVVSRSDVEDSTARVFAIAAAATLLTHPFAWIGTLELSGILPYAAIFAIVELVVVAVEAVIFRTIAGWPNSVAIMCAALANAASAGTGLLIWALL